MHLRCERAVLRIVSVLIILSLSLGASGDGMRLAAQEPQTLGALCREDGVCLPAPHLATDPAPAAPTSVRAPLQCEAALLIKRTPEVSAASFGALLQNVGYSETEGLLVPQWWRVCAQSPDDVSGELARILATPAVSAAEEEGYLTLSATPNDPYYFLQWGLPKIGAPDAWDITTGSTGVLVAVVDTGVDYGHPDRPYDLWVGWDYVNDDSDPFDDNGHGTHVTGIATAATNNSTGVAGLCTGCSALAVKVLGSDGRGSTGDVADGIAEAAYDGAYLGKRTVINVSAGGPYSELLEDAVTYAQQSGALVVAAAGNGEAGPPSYPAALAGVIAVSATDSLDIPAGFSQYGDIGAPGVAIWSTVPEWYALVPYKSWDGTSMASPLVAAAAGLVWSAHPTYTATEVTQSLLSNVTVPAGWDSRYGRGRLNVARAVSPPIYSFRVYLPLVVR